MLKQVQHDEEKEEAVLVEPWTIRLSKRLLMLHIIAGAVLAGHYLPIINRAKPDLLPSLLAIEVGITAAKIAIWYFLFPKKKAVVRWVFAAFLGVIWLNIALNGAYWHVNTIFMMGILTAILPLLFLKPSKKWFQESEHK